MAVQVVVVVAAAVDVAKDAAVARGPPAAGHVPDPVVVLAPGAAQSLAVAQSLGTVLLAPSQSRWRRTLARVPDLVPSECLIIIHRLTSNSGLTNSILLSLPLLQQIEGKGHVQVQIPIPFAEARFPLAIRVD